MAAMSSSGVRSEVKQNYAAECEAAVNAQVLLELEALYTYLAMAAHCRTSDVALHGFAQLFSDAAKEEMQHVQLLTNYQNQRGGKVLLEDIKAPEKTSWATGEGASGFVGLIN